MEKIGEGLETEVYLVDKHVEKYFKKSPGKKIYLTEDVVDKMKHINTKRILLPRDTILDADNLYVGYKMDYIENKGTDSYFALDKEKLKEENKIIREDLEILSDNKILIEDLLDENTSYNNGIYSIDPGSFKFSENLDSNQVYGINMDLFNEYLIFEVILNYHLNKYKNGFSKSFSFSTDIDREYNRSGKNDVLEFLSEMDENNLSSFVEKRVNRTK